MNYLIPANTKKGQLILGLFRPFDLILFGSGVLVSILLLSFLPLGDVWVTILALAPGLITGFLVLPVKYYHNMLNILVELYEFITNRQTYKWKGWCWRDGKKVK
ncbi:MAG: hypothetical protein IJ842_02605 [Bacilli bacterium]|nr:hypothetical protein [Bacilli bacterium]